MLIRYQLNNLLGKAIYMYNYNVYMGNSRARRNDLTKYIRVLESSGLSLNSDKHWPASTIQRHLLVCLLVISVGSVGWWSVKRIKVSDVLAICIQYSGMNLSLLEDFKP